MPNNSVEPANVHHHLDKTLKEEAIHVVTKFSLVWVECLRWITIVVPLYLSTWRWAEIRGYPDYVNTTFPNLSETDTFLAVSGIGLMTVSLVIYLPIKVFILRYKWRNKLFSDNRW